MQQGCEKEICTQIRVLVIINAGIVLPRKSVTHAPVESEERGAGFGLPSLLSLLCGRSYTGT